MCSQLIWLDLSKNKLGYYATIGWIFRIRLYIFLFSRFSALLSSFSGLERLSVFVGNSTEAVEALCQLLTSAPVLRSFEFEWKDPLVPVVPTVVANAGPLRFLSPVLPSLQSLESLILRGPSFAFSSAALHVPCAVLPCIASSANLILASLPFPNNLCSNFVIPFSHIIVFHISVFIFIFQLIS